MSAAVEILTRCRSLHIDLSVHDDKLKVSAPTGAVDVDLRALLAANKLDLLRALRRNDKTRMQTPSELPALVRQHFREACERLQIDPEPVMTQFDLWRYTEADLIEMDAWPTSTVMQHCLLLASEVAEGMTP